MDAIIYWIEAVIGGLPLPLLEVWGRFAFFIGLALAIGAFGGFTFRPGGRWGFGRERQAWDAKAVLSIPVTFILIVVTGYLGSFVVLVPGAQTFESLKDLVVFLCIILFGYPALITVPFAYGLSDLIEGVPPDFLLDWLPGYFINPACFWIAYQLFGKNPDFQRARTWGMYLIFVLLFMSIEPALWGFICAGKFTAAISYRNITSALFFTTGITWIVAPVVMLVAFPVTRKIGMFWAEIPGHVKERRLDRKEWVWEAGGGKARPELVAMTEGWPIRMVLLAPFIALVLLMVGATAYVTLRSAEADANKLATRLHQEISDNINLQLDEYLARAPAAAANTVGISSLLKGLPVSQNGLALVIDRSGRTIASSIEDGHPIAASAAAAGLKETLARPAQLKAGIQFRLDHVTAKPLSRETWLARATAYQDRRGGHDDWIVLTAMPESFYLAGVQAGNSRSAMIFALALLLSLAVAAVLAATVTDRLRRISLATQALAQGDLTQRVPGSRMEELGTLAQSFNDMAVQLQNSFNDLLGEVETRKKRERELEESEARVRTSEDRLQLATKAASLAIWDWDVEKDELVWDDAMYQLYGVRKDEFGGAYEAWSSCLAPEDFVRATDDVEAALRGEREFVSEFRVRLKDGSTRFIRGAARTIRDKSGRPVRMVGINWDVTEQLMAERTLRERETFLRLAQEAAHVGSWEWDLRTNSFKWSDELVRIHGITSTEFDGKLETIMAFCHPRDVGRLRGAMEQIGAGADLDGFECRIVRRDGVERDLWFLGQMHRDERGAPAKVLGIAIDITERKRRDLLLAEETRILGMIAAGAPLSEILTAIVLSIEAISKDTIGSILILDPDGIHMRHGAAPNLPDGYNRAVDGAAIGSKAGSCGTAAYRREPVIVSDIETDPLWEDYRELARTHGLRACWSMPIKDARGAVLGTFAMYYKEPRSPRADDLVLIQRATHLAGVAIDRKHAEDSQRESEEKFRELAETIEDAFWISDPEKHRIFYISPAYEKIWGRACQSLYDKPRSWLESIHPEDRERVLRSTTMRAHEGSSDEEYRIIRPDGSERWIRDLAFPVRDAAGHVQRIVGVARDITEHRILEQQLRQSQKMEAIGQLAGGVAHDFNNILAVMMMQSSLAASEENVPDEVLNSLQQIHLCAERAANLTRQLLLFSRKQVMQPRDLDLNEVVTSLSKMLQRLIGADVSLQLHLHPTLLRARADAGMIDQVLMNLAVNARDAMPSGGRLLIETAAKQVDENRARLHPDASPGSYVCLSVSDTGDGIPPEVLPRIFEPFFTTKEPGKGTGLGLATVFGIVKQHRGWIQVESKPGAGTRFQIFIPACAAPPSGAVTEAIKPQPRGGTETILLVEDEVSVRAVTRAVLERSGYTVVEAASGVEALRLWPEHHRQVALVLTDLVMPGGVNGQELARKLHEERRDLKIIFTSGYSAEIASRALELRAGEIFVQKPCPADQLLETVRACLDG